MKQPKDILLRKFLNRKGFNSFASIIAAYEFSGVGTYLTLQISDCSRSIALDLSCCNKKELENTKYKLKTIREAIELIEENLETSYEWDEYCKNKNKKS